VKTIIFSIGAIGRLFYRKFNNNSKYNIIGFIDNNKELKGQFYDDKPIYMVDDIINLDFDKVLIGGVHYEAMENQLKDLGITEDKIEMIEDSQISYSDDIRSKKVDELVYLFCDIMEKENIKYYLIASSLLSLLRGDDLAKVSDVDIMLDSKEDLKRVYEIFKQYEEKFDMNVTNYLVDKQTNFLNIGDSSFVTIASKSDPKISEPAMIDVNILFESKNHRFYRLGDKYIYFDKKYFEEIKYLDYKNIKMPVPHMYDQYLIETYGEGYIVPPARWSEDDFITLVSENDLLEVIK